MKPHKGSRTLVQRTMNVKALSSRFHMNGKANHRHGHRYREREREGGEPKQWEKNVNHLHTISGYAKKINGNDIKTKTYTEIHVQPYRIQVIIAFQLLDNQPWKRCSHKRKNKPQREREREKWNKMDVWENKNGYEKAARHWLDVLVDGWCLIRWWKWITSGHGCTHTHTVSYLREREIPICLLCFSNIWNITWLLAAGFYFVYVFSILFAFLAPYIFRNTHFVSPQC